MRPRLLQVPAKSRGARAFTKGRHHAAGSADSRGHCGWRVFRGHPRAAHAQPEAVGESEGPHHLSLVIASTANREEDETAFTFGIDHEYRVGELLGLGFVAEHAFGEVDSTTLIAAAAVHLRWGFAVQLGPGVEFADGEAFPMGRDRHDL